MGGKEVVTTLLRQNLASNVSANLIPAQVEDLSRKKLFNRWQLSAFERTILGQNQQQYLSCYRSLISIIIEEVKSRTGKTTMADRFGEIMKASLPEDAPFLNDMRPGILAVGNVLRFSDFSSFVAQDRQAALEFLSVFSAVLVEIDKEILTYHFPESMNAITNLRFKFANTHPQEINVLSHAFHAASDVFNGFLFVEGIREQVQPQPPMNPKAKNTGSFF